MNLFLKKHFLKISMLLTTLLVLPLPDCNAAGGYRDLDNYDTMHMTLKGRKWPPWIPGTEGQKEARIQVLDAATMEPIEGAIVVGGYYGPDGRLGTACARSESAASDKDGWVALPNDQDPRVGDGGISALRGPDPVSAYKRGYQLTSPVYYAKFGGNNEWYVVRMTAAPYGMTSPQWKKISARKFSTDHKSALMETKERSRIYLMPSTAKTKEERSRELSAVSRACGFTQPFGFTSSEGMLAVWKAAYQEKLDIGFKKENLSYDSDMLRSYAQSYQEFRQESAQGK